MEEFIPSSVFHFFWLDLSSRLCECVHTHLDGHLPDSPVNFDGHVKVQHLYDPFKCADSGYLSKSKGYSPTKLKLERFLISQTSWKEQCGCAALVIEPWYFFVIDQNMSVKPSLKNCRILKSGIQCHVRIYYLIRDVFLKSILNCLV